MLGETPEGQWALFSSPEGDGSEMISVVVPHGLWRQLTKADPFTSQVALMTQAGTAALKRLQGQNRLQSPVWVEASDLPVKLPVDPQWYPKLRQCGRCGRLVPPGEVLEGFSNAMPPDSRGEVEIRVLCPDCKVQTSHRLTPWGIPID